MYNLIRREIRSISRARISIALGLMSFNLIANVIAYFFASRSQGEFPPQAQIEASKTVFVSATALGSICAILLTMDTFQRDRIKGMESILLNRVTRDEYVIAKALGACSVILGISFPTLAVLVLLPVRSNAWSPPNVLLASLLTNEYLLLIGSVTILLAVKLEEQAKAGLAAFLAVILFDVLETVPYVRYLSPKTYFLSGLHMLISNTPAYSRSFLFHLMLLGTLISLFAVTVRRFRSLDL